MLSLRLRSARGVRTRYVCSSCCAHLPRGTGAHCRGFAATRTYATKKGAADPSPGESLEDLSSPDAMKELEPAQNPKVRRVESQMRDKKKDVRTEESENLAPRKKKAPKPSDANKGQTVKAVKPSKINDTTAKLWQETLDVLTNIRMAQDTAEDAALGNGGAKRSLKSQFPPIHSAQSNAAIERQAKLLEGTLDVLKSVLTIEADKRSKAGQTAGSTKTPDSETKPGRKPTAGKSKKDEDKKLPAGKSAPSEIAVPKGFSALVQIARANGKDTAEKEVPGGEVPKKKSVGRTPSARPSSLKNKAASDKDGHSWGSTKTPRDIKTIKTKNQGLEPIPMDTAPVPRVEYGLHRVLFNEGVYVLQDPRTRVFNFDPYLASIMPVSEFDFDALKQYVTSSKDTTLIGVAKKYNKKFTGSTSSMTSTLAHFHYLLSSWRPINPERISRSFEPDSSNFGVILRAPAATFLHYKDGTYAIDADKEYDTDTILSMLGKSMEKLLTAPKHEYEKYRRSNSHQLTEEERNADESYHYTTFGDFMMRSQLDAYDPRLPGTGVFDLKTRAVVSIRMDARNHHKGVGYEIRQRQGQWESFEREYYDMIRLAFLKYSLQVRMGRMDGIFVAYHNTRRIFGFQYIPLEEMDLSIHGTTDLTTGNREFMASLELYEELLQKATERFPNQSLRVHVETRPSTVVPFMYFFAEPVNDDEIKAIQEQNKEQGEKFQEEVLGIKRKPSAPEQADTADLDQSVEASTEDVEAAEVDWASKAEEVEEARGAEEDAQEIDEDGSEDVWEDMMEVIEQTMESDAQGISAIRDAIEGALEQSGLLQARSSEEAEQYVEALLKAMVDVDGEKVSTSEEAVATGTAESSPPAPQRSRFSFLTSWFRSGTKEADTTAKQDVTSLPESEKNISTLPREDPAVKDDAPEAAVAESKAGDDKPDDSLKDLLIKLTTRIGSSIEAQKATVELSEDQAKLRNFKSILLDMMPKTQEAPEEAEAKGYVASTGDKSTQAPKDTPVAASSGEEPTTKPVLGLILTVRNKVNRKYVQRPEKLASGDKWQVEYTIEEVAEDKVQSLYEQIKKRRRTAYYKEPGRDVFQSAFDGQLPYYSKEGMRFRKEEMKLARKQPLHVAWRDQPLWLPGSSTGAASRHRPLVGFIPDIQEQEETPKSPSKLSLERLPTRARRTDSGPRDAMPVERKKAGSRGPLVGNEPTMTTKKTVVEEESVMEVAEKPSTSFREWRERSQEAQAEDKEQEGGNGEGQEKEKDP